MWEGQQAPQKSSQNKHLETTFLSFFASTFPWNAEKWLPSSQLQRRKEKGREYPFPWAGAAPSRFYRLGLRRDPAEPTREQSTYHQLLVGRKSMGWAGWRWERVGG